MARMGADKRRKELARSERRKEKATAKVDRKRDKLARAPGAPGEDPDLAGIVAGPQPTAPDLAEREGPK